MSDPIFPHVTVTASPVDNSKLIEWYLDPDFCDNISTFNFYVEVSQAIDEWTRLNPLSPVINENIYTDDIKRRYNTKNDIFYRIVLDDNGTEYYSYPVRIVGALSKSEFLTMKEILRKEYWRFTKQGSGISGRLYKRRTYGIKCPDCRDFDSDAIVKGSMCETCYGTGYVYGYFNAYTPYWIEYLEHETSKTEVNIPFTTEDVLMKKARHISYPTVNPYDMWVEEDTNRRFVFRQIVVAAAIRNVPMIYVSIMTELPPTRIHFDVPVEGEPGSSAPESWRSAISFVE